MPLTAEKAPAREPFFGPRIIFAAIALIGATYFLQAATPLRLDDDTVDYLNMASAITDGRPIPNLPLPDGYPRIISALEHAGLAASVFFVVANCLFLGIGFLSFWKFREYSDRSRLVAILAGLLAIPIIKSAPIALPDAAFFAVSLLSLWCLATADNSDSGKRIPLLVAASLLTVAAISLRYAGIALIPPLIWVFARRHWVSRHHGLKPVQILAEAMVLVLFAAALAGLMLNSRVFTLYVGQAHTYYADPSLTHRLLNRLAVVLKSAGEIAVNIPYSRFHSLGNFFLVSGILATAVAVALLRRPIRLTAQRVFLIFYLLLLVAWPNPAPRLWMPIIPLLAAEAYQVFEQRTARTWVRRAVQVYAVWFCITGVGALAYSTRISLSGSRFTQLYGKAGGMADPDIKEGDPSWDHVQYYKRSVPLLLSRYGDKRAMGQ